MYASLNPKHRLFVDAYYRRWNATVAAREAGYCPDHEDNQRKYGSWLLNRPDVQAALRELQFDTSKQTRMTLEEITKRLERDIEAPMMLAKDRHKATEMLIRMRGGFIDKQDISLKGAVKLKWADTDEDMSWLD